MTAALKPLDVALVVMVATGGYETELACALQAAGMPVAVVNPRQAHDFAKSMGRLAKTDTVNARMLAEFAAVLRRREDLARFLPAGRPAAAMAGRTGLAPAPTADHAAQRTSAAANHAQGAASEH